MKRREEDLMKIEKIFDNEFLIIVLWRSPNESLELP